VIDTLQHIRKESPSANHYANDYNELKLLKEIAYKHKIAILLVHHLRKMHDEDPLYTLSGTTGLLGASDSTYILTKDSRIQNRATLFCTGRDFETVELKLCYDEKKYVWALATEADVEIKFIDEQMAYILEYMKTLRSKFSGTATDLSDEIKLVTGAGIGNAVVRKKLFANTALLKELGFELNSFRQHSNKII
jgi:hypothetical protein